MHPKGVFFRTWIMKKNEDFKGFFEIKPQKDLASKVFLRILNENQSMLKRKQLFAGVSFLLSILTIIPATLYAVNQFKQTGFYSYLALVWQGDFVSYWKDLLMILAESLPVYSVLMFLSVLLVLLMSGFVFLRNRKNGIYFYHYA